MLRTMLPHAPRSLTAGLAIAILLVALISSTGAQWLSDGGYSNVGSYEDPNGGYSSWGLGPW